MSAAQLSDESFVGAALRFFQQNPSTRLAVQVALSNFMNVHTAAALIRAVQTGERRWTPSEVQAIRAGQTPALIQLLDQAPTTTRGLLVAEQFRGVADRRAIGPLLLFADRCDFEPAEPWEPLAAYKVLLVVADVEARAFEWALPPASPLSPSPN